MCWARSWLAIGRKWVRKQANSCLTIIRSSLAIGRKWGIKQVFISLAREGYTLFIRGFLAILVFLGFLEFQGLLGFLVF